MEFSDGELTDDRLSDLSAYAGAAVEDDDSAEHSQPIQTGRYLITYDNLKVTLLAALSSRDVGRIASNTLVDVLRTRIVDGRSAARYLKIQ